MRFSILMLAIIFVVNILGMYLNWYEFFGFDMILHFLGGFFVALLFFHYLRPHFLPKAKAQNMLILVGATMFIGVVWEFAEYVANQMFSESASAAFGIRIDFMGNLDDTIKDLLMDMLGVFTLSGLLLNNRRSSK